MLIASYKFLFQALAISLPLVVLVVVARHLLSIFRSLRDKRFKGVAYSIGAIAALLLLFAGLCVVWFIHGVSHAAKPFSEELILVLGSTALIYGSGFALWRFARRIDEHVVVRTPSSS